VSNLKLLRESLADVQSPRSSDSAWVAPFELPMGAAYALLAAAHLGYSRRDGRKYVYHTHVRQNIAALLAEYTFSPPAAIWSTAAPGVQLEFVCAAFSLLCHSYAEMMSWHTDARDGVLTALGELA